MKMKAIVCTKYGSPEVLQIKEVEKPVPGDKEVLIKIHATTAHIGDTRIRRADPFFVRLIFGLLRPKRIPILGMEMSGVIEQVGRNVERFEVGDEVFAFTGFQFGGYAEYICISGEPIPGKIEKKGIVERKPRNLSFEEAATVPAGALTVLKVFDKVDLRKGQKVLINGASGSLGTYAVQYAKNMGAEVTGVCSSGNFQLIRSLGADHVIDYSREDFRNLNERFDIIFDAVGKTSRSKCRRILKENGQFLNMSFQKATYQSQDLLNVLTDKQREILSSANKHGYYDYPRKIKSEDLAKKVKISRTTLVEHLRKAEGRIMKEILTGQK